MSSTPHDALFKAVFSQPEHARGTLQTIVPPALAEMLDWRTLTLRPGSFVDAALTHQHTNLLYSATLRDGASALLYFLFEHQSAPPTDGLMGLRLLRYQERIWDRWRAENPRAKTLPAILPIVLYHGAALWSEPRSFEDFLHLPAELRTALEAHLVRFTYLLHDLSQISDDELRDGAERTALTRLTTLCFKHARTSADFLQLLRRWIDVVREVAAAPNGLEALAHVLRYILEVTTQGNPEAMEALLEREVSPQAKETLVTLAQQLIERGHLQGMERGVEKGTRQVLLRQLQQRFGDEVDLRVEQRVAAAPAEQLEVWVMRVLSAKDLADVFAS